MTTFRGIAWVLTVFSVATVSCAGLEPLPEDVDGVWKARRPGGGEHIRLDLYRGPVGHRETPRTRLVFHVGEIEGLDEKAFRRSNEPLVFRLERDAGTLVFEGARERRPTGSFRFERSAEFAERMNSLGLRGVDDEPLIRFAIYGVSTDLLESLAAAGVSGRDADDLLRLHYYDLSPDWIAAMSRLAGPPDFEELIALRNRGVGARQVDRWIAAGLQDLPVADLVRLQIYGVGAEKVAHYRELGFTDTDEWLTFYRNGVPDALIAAAVDAGVPGTNVEEIIRLYIHGVGAADVSGAKGLIAAGFDWDALIYLWRRGITTRYAERLIDSGWPDLEPEFIARLASAGIETDWALRVRAAGDDLSIEDLVLLRQYGLRAGDYESYASGGYTEVDDVRTLVLTGVEPGWIARVREHFRGDLSADDAALLYRRGVDESLLRQLAEAGFEELEVEEAIEARNIGAERWIDRPH